VRLVEEYPRVPGMVPIGAWDDGALESVLVLHDVRVAAWNLATDVTDTVEEAVQLQKHIDCSLGVNKTGVAFYLDPDTGTLTYLYNHDGQALLYRREVL
jgi:hypothetical protein